MAGTGRGEHTLGRQCRDQGRHPSNPRFLVLQAPKPDAIRCICSRQDREPGMNGLPAQTIPENPQEPVNSSQQDLESARGGRDRMARVITIVPCVSKKRKTKQLARDLYISPLFLKAAAYAEKTSDEWHILSARYGLVRPSDLIKPYNVTLNNMAAKDRREWADRVFSDLEPLLQTTDTVVFLAGVKYRQYLVKKVEKLGCRVEIPMEGLRIGEQLRWLKNQLEAR